MNPPKGSREASPSIEGGYVLLTMSSIWWRLHVTHNFVRSRARRKECHRKLAEVVPHNNMSHPFMTASKLVAS